MKTVRIITLHLAYGGIEKAVCQMANLFAEKYDVEIISVCMTCRTPRPSR